jgi:phosphoglycolate phosphatase-like HAD superfamily hydrolase
MTYIFDFDGVLANTFDLYVEFISKSFFLSKSAATKLILKHTYKNDKPKLYEKVLEMFNTDKLERFLQDKPNILFQDRVEEILKLDGQKIILTRNYTQFVEDIMIDYLDTFSLVIGFNEAQDKTLGFSILRDTHGIDLSESIFVTDTVGDIIEAKPFLRDNRIFAADWGYNSVEDLMKVIDHSQIISDLTNLHIK